MTEDAFKQQIEALVPKSLDDIIRRHREQATLRFSTESDLREISVSMAIVAEGVCVSKWCFVTLDVHAGGVTQKTIHLCGIRDDNGHSWCTSPVAALDLTAGLLRTRSESVYRLRGAKGADRDLDLLCLCAYLHKTAIGAYLGVPRVFY